MPFGLPEKTSLDYQKVFKSVVPLGQTDGLEKKEKTTEEAGHFNCVSWNLDAMEHIKTCRAVEEMLQRLWKLINDDE